MEAYVLKNAYKEKLRRMEEAEARRSSDAGGAAVEKEEVRGSVKGGGRRGLFGLMKKKVHPRAAGAAMKTTSEASS